MLNPLAVILGILYGLAAAGTCYVVSMVASGLFARAFYRIYARVLIGICSAMLLVPLLRWISPHPVAARILLTAMHYATLAVLGYGVVRFNREFMKTVFLEKHLTAFFTFGTLVNAAVVTAVFLHIAATGAASDGASRLVVGPEHYGPFVMLLAAMIFHTDYHLKKATADGRRFSKFTFVGYAVSFVAIAISTLPYFGSAFAVLGLGNSFNKVELAFLENFSCARDAAAGDHRFWRPGVVSGIHSTAVSAAASLCGEYHVLVTQWFIKAYGAASWGLASLPLFIGVSALAHYFVRLDRKRSERKSRIEGAAEVDALADATPRLRFVVPFQVVTWGLGAALIGLTLWTRFAAGISGPTLLGPAAWLGATFVAYAVYFFVASVFERNHVLIYAGTLLAILAACFGWMPPAGPHSTVALALLGASFAGLAWVGERFALKREYRTPLADSALAAALLVLAIVACRHVSDFGRAGPYWFAPVGFEDGAALFLTAISFVGCARQYRSRLPVYGTVLTIVVAAPMLCAASSFLLCLAAEVIGRRAPSERAGSEDERLMFLGRLALPLKDRLPLLYARPLSAGALPLSLLGLLISATLILRGDLTNSACLGAAVSALVLALTRVPIAFAGSWHFRSGWLLCRIDHPEVLLLGLVSGGLADGASRRGRCDLAARLDDRHGVFRVVRILAQACRGGERSSDSPMARVLLRHAAPRDVGCRHGDSGCVGGGKPWAVWRRPAHAAACGCFTSGGFLWPCRRRLPVEAGSYLSLAVLALAAVSVARVLPLPEGAEGALLATLGLVLAVLSAALWSRVGRTDPAERRRVFPSPWERPTLPLAAAGLQLWLRPLAEFALLFAGLAFPLIPRGSVRRVYGPVPQRVRLYSRLA